MSLKTSFIYETKQHKNDINRVWPKAFVTKLTSCYSMRKFEFETPQPKWYQCPCLWFGKLSQLQCQWPWFSDTGPLVIVTVSGRPLCTEQLINHYNWWVVAPFIFLFIMAIWCEIAICCTYKELRRKYLSDWNKLQGFSLNLKLPILTYSFLVTMCNSSIS